MHPCSISYYGKCFKISVSTLVSVEPACLEGWGHERHTLWVLKAFLVRWKWESLSVSHQGQPIPRDSNLLDHLLGCHNKREQATFLENHGLQHLFPDWVLLTPPPQHSHYLKQNTHPPSQAKQGCFSLLLKSPWILAALSALSSWGCWKNMPVWW